MPRAKQTPRAQMPPPSTSDLPITVLALSDLKPYPKNPRHISKAAIAAVADSLKAFGWQQPIVIDPKRVIVAGHTRRLAALQLGWTHAPTVTIAAKHASAYRLADNRSAEFSSWDFDALPGELASLPTGQLEALPALKPVECMERPIRNHKGDVYDPFLGSGTTLIAAERQRRACYAMEISPAYCDVAVARWEAFTGQTATRER